MKRSDNPEAYDRAIQRYCEGMANHEGSKNLLKETGLSHAQAGLAWYEHDLNPNRVERGCVEATPENVVLLRAGTHPDFEGVRMSWGYIMVACDRGETVVSNLFGVGSGIAREGTRSGKGGAFLNKEPRFYLNANKRAGVEDVKPRLLDPNEVAKASKDYEPKLPVIAKKVKAAKGRAAKRARAAANAAK